MQMKTGSSNHDADLWTHHAIVKQLQARHDDPLVVVDGALMDVEYSLKCPVGELLLEEVESHRRWMGSVEGLIRKWKVR